MKIGKKLEGIMLRVHIGPVTILVSLARVNNLIIHRASDKILRILKGQN